MRSLSRLLSPFVIALLLGGCSSTPSTETEDETPVEQTEPEPKPEPEPEPEPKPEPEPEPEPAPEPKKETSFETYRGLPLVANDVERTGVTCRATDASASLHENRRTCVQQLESQVADASKRIFVTVDRPGDGCPNCVSMLAETSAIVGESNAPRVLFALQKAGTVECTAGNQQKTLEAARKACNDTLKKQAGAIRAGVVLPLVIDEGEPCKTCVAIGATGFIAKTLK